MSPLSIWSWPPSHANGRLCSAVNCFVVLITSAYIFRLLYHSPWSPPQLPKVSKSVLKLMGYSNMLPMVSSVGKRIARRTPSASPRPMASAATMRNEATASAPTASATTSPASAAVWMTSIQSLGCSAHHLIGSITGLGTSAGAMLPVVPSIEEITGPRWPGATECKRLVMSSAHLNTWLPDTGEEPMQLLLATW